MFYILGGTAHLLAGDQVITAHRGDLLVIALGELSPESLLDVQERCDTHFLDSAAWRAARPCSRPATKEALGNSVMAA